MPRTEIREFQRAAEEVATFLKPKLDGNTSIKIVSHADADGMAAAAILARCLYSYNVPFVVRLTLPVGPDEIAELAKEDYGMFVFLDQGSAQMEIIHKFILAKHANVLLIDHHPGPFLEHPNLVYLNPHTCGLNGGRDVSASGAVYSVVEQIDLRFRSLAGLAVVGAIGDRQEFPSGFTGVNETLARRAVDLGLIYQSEGLRLVGRTLNPVVECLRLSSRPYIMGLSGNLGACRSLIDTLGIPHSSVLCNLGLEVERRLADAIFARVGPLATNEEFHHTIWGTLYTATTDDLVGPRDLREYATMLDACGSLQRPEIGVAAGVGDGATQADALALLSSYQEQMLRTMGWLVKNITSFRLEPAFRHIYCGESVAPRMMGEALSLGIESGLIPTDRPVLGMVDEGSGVVKVSARSTAGLAMQGIDVGRALAKSAAKVGGHGSGHDVAAAARIPWERMDEFVKELVHAFSSAGGDPDTTEEHP
jgi:single-stranded-DNA-specific exonuclease